MLRSSATHVPEAELRMPLVWSAERDESLGDMLPMSCGFSPGLTLPESGTHGLPGCLAYLSIWRVGPKDIAHLPLTTVDDASNPLQKCDKS